MLYIRRSDIKPEKTLQYNIYLNKTNLLPLLSFPVIILY